MGIHFLQQVTPPVLPVLHELVLDEENETYMSKFEFELESRLLGGKRLFLFILSFFFVVTPIRFFLRRAQRDGPAMGEFEPNVSWRALGEDVSVLRARLQDVRSRDQCEALETGRAYGDEMGEEVGH